MKTKITEEALNKIGFTYNPGSDSYEKGSYSVQEVGFNGEWSIVKYGTALHKYVTSMEEIREFVNCN